MQTPPDPRFVKTLVMVKPKGKKRRKPVERVRYICHLEERELALVLGSNKFSQLHADAIAGGDPVTDDVRLLILKVIKEEVDRAHEQALQEPEPLTPPPPPPDEPSA